MLQKASDGKSTLIKVMVFSHQATSYYLRQYWPKSMSPYGITGPQLLYRNMHCPIMSIECKKYFIFGKFSISKCEFMKKCMAADFIKAITHWGRVMHICVSKLTIIGPDNGLLPGRRQAIIWTNDGILFIGPLGTNFSEILIEIYTFSFKKMHLKMSSGNWQPSSLRLNVLTIRFT